MILITLEPKGEAFSLHVALNFLFLTLPWLGSNSLREKTYTGQVTSERRVKCVKHVKHVVRKVEKRYGETDSVVESVLLLS